MDEKTIVKEEVLEEKDFVVELSGLIDSKLLSTGLDQANFLEIETPKPVLQIGNLLFQGAFEPFLGTAVCFQQTDQNKPTTSSENNGDRHSTDLKFLSKSDLKLPMKRVYLERKKANEEETEPESLENREEEAQA